MSTIRQRFLEFHKQNPHIYMIIVRMARQAADKGYRKIGIKMIFEVIRWRHMVRTKRDSSGFKINNNYAPYYARMVMENNPSLDGIFETRELHEPGGGEN